MKRLLLFLSLLAAIALSHAQQRQYVAALRPHGTNGNSVELAAMHVDGGGNQVLAGGFYEEMDADPGSGTALLYEQFGAAAFIIKLDPLGQLDWAVALQSLGDIYIHGIGSDQAGNLYLTGYAGDSIDLDPGPGVQMAWGGGNEDFFILSLSATGQYRWGHCLGSSDYDMALDIAVDAAGNAVMTGTIQGETDFDPGPGQHLLTPAGPASAFVARYDTDGNLQWAIHASGNGGAAGLGIDLDSQGNAVFSGLFTGTIDFDPAPGTTYMLSVASGMQNGDAFVAKLSPGGGFIWAVAVGNADSLGREEAFKPTCNADGEVYLLGSFDGEVDFDPSPTSSYPIQSQTSNSPFLLHLDSAGGFMGALLLDGPGGNYPLDMALDAQGDVVIVGQFLQTMDLDPGAGSHPVTSSSFSNGYVVRLSSEGNFLGGYPIAGEYTYAGEVEVSAAGAISVGGAFSDSVDFDPGPGLDTLQSPGKKSSFLLGDVSIAVATQGIAEPLHFQAFPNPVGLELNLEVPEAVALSGYVLEVMDLHGRTVLHRDGLHDQRFALDLDAISPGVYLLRLVASRGSSSMMITHR